MGYKRKSEKPNIILRRQWKELFERVCRVEDYAGVGKLILSIYEELDGIPLTAELSVYLQAVFDFLICDIKQEHQDYVATCDKNASNRTKKTNVNFVNDGERTLTKKTNVNEINLTSQDKSSTSTSSITSTSTSSSTFLKKEDDGPDIDPYLAMFDSGGDND